LTDVLDLLAVATMPVQSTSAITNWDQHSQCLCSILKESEPIQLVILQESEEVIAAINTFGFVIVKQLVSSFCQQTWISWVSKIFQTLVFAELAVTIVIDSTITIIITTFDHERLHLHNHFASVTAFIVARGVAGVAFVTQE